MVPGGRKSAPKVLPGDEESGLATEGGGFCRVTGAMGGKAPSSIVGASEPRSGTEFGTGVCTAWSVRDGELPDEPLPGTSVGASES